ncbi:MAG TPA: fused MFS/spermidine synthase [Myxococcota bacterium]|nr:fused MFS/spermidine synthase [Myxococcota bacterium]
MSKRRRRTPGAPVPDMGLAPPLAPEPVTRWALWVFAAACFFVSGATGLVYEVTWSRRLELSFGSTQYSIGVVLAAYMAGMGLGAWRFGRLADRAGSPARRYAALEAGIGVYGLLAPFVLDGIEWGFVALGGRGGVFTKAVLGLLALLPPTVLMGATLPVLSRALVRARDDTQSAVGVLYGLNTLGGMAGSVLAGLLLVQSLGMDATSRFTGVVNLALAGLVFALGRRFAPAIEADAGEDEPAELAGVTPLESPVARLWRLRAALAATFAVGAIALALEVAWTRALGAGFGATAHGFTIVLAATLLGIGLGSLGVAREPADERAPLLPLALALLVLAASSCVFLLGFDRLPALFFLIVQPRALSYEQLLSVLFGVSALVVLPATLSMGVAFPLSVQLATASAERAGRSVGRVYLANTAGAILGSLAGSFALVPWLGSQGVVRLCALGSALAAGGICAVAARYGGWSRARAIGIALPVGGLLLVALALPGWDMRRLDLDPMRIRNQLPRGPGELADTLVLGGVSQVYAREGLNALVTVRQSGTTKALMIGGKADASTPSDMPSQILVAAVPMISAEKIGRVLVIGAGSGVTARVAAEFAGVERVDVVEIEPAMVEAASRHFDGENHGVFRRDNVRVIYEDGRTHLLASPDSYDVIISEPTNPFISGVANLFTAEHYANARARLAPGGVYLQWVQTYSSSDWMVRAMIQTFVQSFEHVDLWWSSPDDLLLLGSQRPLVYDRNLVTRRVAVNPGLAKDLEPVLYARSPDDLFARFLLHKDELTPLLAGAETLHDKLPRLESRASRNRYQPTGIDALLDDVRRVRAARATLWPVLTTAPPDDTPLRLAAVRFRGAEAGPELDLIRNVDRDEAFLLRARALADDPAQARAVLEEGRKRFPDSRPIALELARVSAALGDAQTAAALLTGALKSDATLEPQYALLGAQLTDPRSPQGAQGVIEAVGTALASLRPRKSDYALREPLLELLASVAPRAPQASDILHKLYDKNPWDELAGTALAHAQYLSGDYAGCLATADLLAKQNSLWNRPPLRALRLQALAAQHSPELRAETLRFMDDFPQEPGRTWFRPFIRALRQE